MNTFVLGDIHGHHEQLKSVLNASKFNMDEDQLICLGDVCDRGPDVLGCIKTLSNVKNLVYILGNHDQYVLQYLHGDFKDTKTSPFKLSTEYYWLTDGGYETKDSIKDEEAYVFDFLKKAKPFYIYHNKLFVHGGIIPDTKVEENALEILLWDRRMVESALDAHKKNKRLIHNYDEVYCGHTPTLHYNATTPLHYSNVWLMDTGCAYQTRGGKLSIMNISSKQIWQSP